MAGRPLALALLPLVLAVAGPACASDAADAIVARMGNAVLRVSDLGRLLDAQSPEVRRQIVAAPVALDRLARTEMYRRVLLEEARAKGWDKRPEVAVQVERASEQALVSSYMNSLARPAADYPGDAEIAALYKEREAALTVPRQLRLAQIFIDARASGDGAEARRKAEKLGRRARAANADFAALARANSEHKSSADMGGDMGWLAETEVIPEMRSALARLAPGQVSDPIRSDSGWHVVKVIDIRPAAVRPLAEVRDALVVALRERKARESEQRHLDRLVEKAPLSVNEAALATLLDSKGSASPR